MPNKNILFESVFLLMTVPMHRSLSPRKNIEIYARWELGTGLPREVTLVYR